MDFSASVKTVDLPFAKRIFQVQFYQLNTRGQLKTAYTNAAQHVVLESNFIEFRYECK